MLIPRRQERLGDHARGECGDGGPGSTGGQARALRRGGRAGERPGRRADENRRSLSRGRRTDEIDETTMRRGHAMDDLLRILSADGADWSRTGLVGAMKAAGVLIAAGLLAIGLKRRAAA